MCYCLFGFILLFPEQLLEVGIHTCNLRFNATCTGKKQNFTSPCLSPYYALFSGFLSNGFHSSATAL